MAFAQDEDAMFKLLAQDAASKAHRGRLTTAHGVIETPVFMPAWRESRGQI